MTEKDFPPSHVCGEGKGEANTNTCVFLLLQNKRRKRNCATKNKHKTVTGENGKSSSPFLEHVVKQHHDEDMAQPSSEHTLVGPRQPATARTPPTP